MDRCELCLLVPVRLVVVAVAVLVALGAEAQETECTPIGGATVRCAIPIVEDTLLYIENEGVTRLLIDVNGHVFKLASDTSEVLRSDNAFPMPREGSITVNIGALIRPDENFIELTAQGPSGSLIPRVILANVLLVGQSVAYAIGGLEPLPQRLSLLQSYPNPFLRSTTLTFTVPEGRTAGVPVRLTLYDARGRRIRVLADDTFYPGSFAVRWNGEGPTGTPVASGLYIAHLVVEDVRQVVKLTRLK